MVWGVKVLVFLKDGILDTQGKAVAASLERLGYSSVKDLRVGKYLHLKIEATSKDQVRDQVTRMCRDLLVNDIIEDWSMSFEDEASL